MDKLLQYLPSKEIIYKDLPLALAMACMAVGTYLVTVVQDSFYGVIFYGLAVVLAILRMFMKEYDAKKKKK